MRTRQFRVLCATCRGQCLWADDAWTCRSCGDEWNSDHDSISYAEPDKLPVWEPIRSPHDRRRVVYYRLSQHLGAVMQSGPDGTWRALAYPRIKRGPNIELGCHASRISAQAAVEDHVRNYRSDGVWEGND